MDDPLQESLKLSILYYCFAKQLFFEKLYIFIITNKVPSKHCRFGNQPGQHELRYTHAEIEKIILFVFVVVVVVVVVAIPLHFIFQSIDHESCVNTKKYPYFFLS